MKFYLIGIKGAGMAALANALYEQGHLVSGVDVEDDFYTSCRLKNIAYETFNRMHLKPDCFYVIGNAYKEHKISEFIKNMHFKYMLYPDFIAYYFKRYQFMAVAGSHGKTTTTSLASCFINDVSYIIGDGRGCGKSKSRFLIEACEYRDTFLHYHPDIALILNIDYDHPDYFKTPEAYLESFQKFYSQSKIVIGNGDDENVRKIYTSKMITFGLNPDNEIVFSYVLRNRKTIVKILNQEFELPIFGRQYAYDFVGAYLVAKLLGISDEKIKQRLSHFQMPKRRMEEVTIKQSKYVLDYAHHPTEITAVFETLRGKYPDWKLVCVFEPHTISRTQALLDDFKTSLHLFDEAYLLNLFTSIREHIDLALEKKLYQYLKVPTIKKTNIFEFNKERTIYVFLGAGNIDKTFERITQYFKR